jgi:hypothetical protein
MGLKGYRLWVMGQLDSNMQSPTSSRLSHSWRSTLRAVALHVAFERETLKPVFHLIGYRLWV